MTTTARRIGTQRIRHAAPSSPKRPEPAPIDRTEADAALRTLSRHDALDLAEMLGLR